jgi:hypothetical protein
MRFRKLRIAWSVGWGVVALLLCVLWVRSYSGLEAHVFRLSQNLRVALVSEVGEVGIAIKIANANSNSVLAALGSDSAYPLPVPPKYRQPAHRRIFVQNQEVYSWKSSIPYWLLVTDCVAITIAPWLGRRFSLRTLLIATTLVAVVLGLLVWMSRAEQ